MKKVIKSFLIILFIAISVYAIYFGIEHFFPKKTINDTILELSVKKALVEIAGKEIKNNSMNYNERYAESHKILGSEIKDKKIYAYVVGEFGLYKIENNVVSPITATATPIAIVFNDNGNGYYELESYSKPKEGDEYNDSLKEIFPKNLIDNVAVDYKDEFYKKQIESYFNKIDNAGAQDILLDVMNNKQNLINSENEELLFKDLKIIENETAKVDKYAFVDMDKDGIDELVIYTTSDYGAYVILHYEDYKIYGYVIGIRSLENLKIDGSFMGSSGADSHEYSTIEFDKNSYKINTIAINDNTNEIYKINNNDVTKEKAQEYADNWNKKENIKWSK